jgi:hypothetical protein
VKNLSPVDAVVVAETANTLEEQVGAMQSCINSGICWQMQGSMGRTAMDMMRAGYCTLGEHGNYDAYGDYVPSRSEVKPGTVGSVEYCEARDWGQDIA